jgi:signal peptidase II
MSGRGALLARPLPVLVFVFIAIVLDQASKLAVDHLLPLQEMVPVAPFLALYRTYNTGVAFSMLQGMDGWFIVGMRLVIVAFVLWIWRRTPTNRSFTHLGYALVIAGALGNLLDRFLYGHVIDFILFYTESWSFAVFNLADSFITMGAVAIAIDELFAKKSPDA